MTTPYWLARALALCVVIVATMPLFECRAQEGELNALNGEWVYLEDRTEGRSTEQLGPPMSTKFSLLTEEDVVVLVSGHGSGHKNVRLSLDGTATNVAGSTEGMYARYRSSWKDGTLMYQTDFVREPGEDPKGLIRKEFRMTSDGLLVRVTIGDPAKYEAVAIYRHPENIPLPPPVDAEIGDLGWLAGAWSGTRGSSGTTSIEELWSKPLGGSMLSTARTVSRGKLSSFEYLRVVERDGGLVYIAQPNGGAATEFVATELSEARVVFDNPRHDYPKRIVYELIDGATLNVSIGFIKGGSPRKFEFHRN